MISVLLDWLQGVVSNGTGNNGFVADDTDCIG